MTQPMPVLYFVRHGETDFNVEQRLAGPLRRPRLNARGRQQAERVRQCCSWATVRTRPRQRGDFAYVSSPLQRARETMEIAAPRLGSRSAAYALDDRLMEISYGAWED